MTLQFSKPLNARCKQQVTLETSLQTLSSGKVTTWCPECRLRPSVSRYGFGVLLGARARALKPLRVRVFLADEGLRWIRRCRTGRESFHEERNMFALGML